MEEKLEMDMVENKEEAVDLLPHLKCHQPRIKVR